MWGGKCRTGKCGTNFTACIEIRKQDAQLSQRDRAAGCVIVFAKSRRLELGEYFTDIIGLSSTTIFNHCDIIGLIICRIRLTKTQNKGYYGVGLPTVPYFREVPYFRVCVPRPGLYLPGTQNVPYF